MNILMEYVPGSSLDAILQKFGALDEQVMRTYTRQLLEALNYCHTNRVIHRDIKGKNILVDTHGTLKLADFGSAKQFVEAKAAPSLNYNYTPLWTAPEVLIGDYTFKIDIWSLGCVIIEMATAKQPWDEENFENPFRALYHIGTRLPPAAACRLLLRCHRSHARRLLTVRSGGGGCREFKGDSRHPHLAHGRGSGVPPPLSGEVRPAALQSSCAPRACISRLVPSRCAGIRRSARMLPSCFSTPGSATWWRRSHRASSAPRRPCNGRRPARAGRCPRSQHCKYKLFE